MRDRNISLFFFLIVCSFVQFGFTADGLNYSSLALTSQSRVVPGQMLVFKATVGNEGQLPAEAKLLLSIDELPNIQSARHIALNPGQTEQYDLYIPLPDELAKYEKIHITTTMVGLTGDREVILESGGEPAIRTLGLPVTQGHIFGMAVEASPPILPEWYWPPPTAQSSFELALAARIDAGGKRISATYEMQSLPLNQLQWQGIDLFLIAEPSVLKDPAAVESMRQFMLLGGRVWVMLDKVPSELVRPLLGANQACEEIERVELNDFIIELESATTRLSQEDRQVRSDRDVPMVRVLQNGGNVTHRIDDWPVAITMDIGYGQLLITALDSFVWIEPRVEQISTDAYSQTAFQTRSWGNGAAINANEAKATLPLSHASDYPLRLIGNPVVPRQWVAAALLSFCGALTGLGMWLAYLGRLTVMGMIAPAAALLASGTLLLAANWVRRDIPESVSRLQIVDIGDHGHVAMIREQAAVYIANEANMQLGSQVDGIVLNGQPVSSGTRRMVFDDFQKWRMVNENWPPGVSRYDAEYAVPTEGLMARGSLSVQGLTLSLPAGLPSELQDPVLSFVIGDPLLCQTIGGELVANAKVPIDGGNWITGAIISDEQQRRMETYQQFFTPNPQLHRPTRRLYGWTAPWPGASWNRDLKQQGSALVSLPILLERPRIGEEVFIPHGLVQLRRLATDAGITSVFDDRTGRWREEVSLASQADMEFVLPDEVVPLILSAIDFEMDIVAPQRNVTISIPTEKGTVEIAKLESPSIPWRQTITDPAILQAFQDGKLTAVVKVSDVSSDGGQMGATSIVTWHIDHFRASVHGRTTAKSSLSATK